MSNFKFRHLTDEFDGEAGDVPCVIDSFMSEDMRGSFIKDFNVDVFAKENLPTDLKEVFYTESHRNVLRGLHFQLPADGKGQQAKIVRCIHGKVWDVVVDLRPTSSTYRKSFGMELSGNKQLFVPKGFGHGYFVLEDSIVCYKADEVFSSGDSGIYFMDSGLQPIDWHIPAGVDPILSIKDAELMSFDEYDKLVKAHS